MKKTVLVLFAMMLSFGSFAQFKAAPKVDNMDNFRGNAKAEFATIWKQMASGAAWTVNDINGNSVSLQSYLNEGKFVLLDFSCTWCGPCWNLHQSGMLDQINALENFQVIWIESESTNTTAQIYGPAGGSTYADKTYGNWTVDANGDPVTYPIIDDDANSSCLMPFAELYYGYVPTLMLVAPNGQYCNLSGFYSYQYVTQSVQMIQMVAETYPQAGQEPACYIDGVENCFTNAEVTFEALINSVDPVTSISWSVDGNAAGTSELLTTTFTTAGTHQIILTVANANGTAADTLSVNAAEMPSNVLSYAYGKNEVYNSIGAGGLIYWAVAFPSSMLAGRTAVDHVDCYVAAAYATTYTMSVYSGSATAPETLLGEVSENVTAAIADDYVTFTPASPIAIDQTKTLWIVMSANSTYPAVAAEPCGDPNSNWVSLDKSQWFHSDEVGVDDLSWMIDCYTKGNSGIERLSNVSMSIYPNPASDYVTVRAEGIQEVSVLDLNGRVLSTSSSSKVDVRGLAAGIYVVRVVTNNGVATEKIVKE